MSKYNRLPEVTASAVTWITPADVVAELATIFKADQVVTEESICIASAVVAADVNVKLSSVVLVAVHDNDVELYVTVPVTFKLPDANVRLPSESVTSHLVITKASVPSAVPAIVVNQSSFTENTSVDQSITDIAEPVVIVALVTFTLIQSQVVTASAFTSNTVQVVVSQSTYNALPVVVFDSTVTVVSQASCVVSTVNTSAASPFSLIKNASALSTSRIIIHCHVYVQLAVMFCKADAPDTVNVPVISALPLDIVKLPLVNVIAPSVNVTAPLVTVIALSQFAFIAISIPIGVPIVSVPTEISKNFTVHEVSCAHVELI